MLKRRVVQAGAMSAGCNVQAGAGQSASKCGVRKVASDDEVVRNCDTLRLNMGLMAESKHWLNAARITKMRDGAHVITCVLAGLANEKGVAEVLIACSHALVAAVDGGHARAVAGMVPEAEAGLGAMAVLFAAMRSCGWTGPGMKGESHATADDANGTSQVALPP